MLRGLIKGGYEAALAVAKATRDDIFVRQRGSLPLKAQLDKANTLVEPTEKCLEAENKKGQKLAAQQAELREKIAEQRATTAAVEAKLALAKTELAAISAKVSAEYGTSEGAALN